jgi:hypothetical protein
MPSVFRMDSWRNARHMLNPSKWKEHQLEASGLGLLNTINFIPDYTERFTSIDPVTEQELSKFHKSTRIFLQRKQISSDEKKLLAVHGFEPDTIWGTLVVDLDKFSFDKLSKNTRYDIRRGEGLVFDKVKTEISLKDYYHLLRYSRLEEGLATQSYYEFVHIFNKLGGKHYDIFLARDQVNGDIYAAIGLIYGGGYTFQGQLARDKGVPFASTWLTYTLLAHLKEQGYRYFDLVGINPNPEPNSKDEGIRAFKEKWLGEYQNVYEYVRS